jgi:anti-anti-sigma regulatory factor
MRIERSSNELVITGNIKSIEDSMAIKDAIGAQRKAGATAIIMRIRDSFSMTSTVIGHLMKLVRQENVPVTLLVEDHRLFQLLEDLNLVQLFNVRHIGA